jgi:hypothetical protein
MVKKRTSKARKTGAPRGKTQLWMTPSETHKIYLAVSLLLITICLVSMASGEVYHSADGGWHLRLRDRSGHALSVPGIHSREVR